MYLQEFYQQYQCKLYVNCDIIFKGTSVNGVYNSDPKKNLNSKMYKNISYKKVLADNLQVMDSSAISMARDNLIPMVVFSILEKNSFLNASQGEGTFTLISEEK